MQIALCQFDQVWEDPKANRDKIRGLVEECTGSYDWIVFPEMTLSGFTMNRDIATTTGEDLAFFRGLARDRAAWVSFGGVQDGYNRLFTLDRKGNVASSYSKMHLYSFAGEDKDYKPGTHPETFDLEGFKVTPAICFDLRFPQLFWDRADQTEVYVVIASWPARRSEHWMTLLRARAIENQAYVVGVDRTGADPFLEYSGNSMLYDPLGKVVLDSGDREGIHIAPAIDKALVARTRERFPFFKDRPAGG